MPDLNEGRYVSILRDLSERQEELKGLLSYARREEPDLSYRERIEQLALTHNEDDLVTIATIRMEMEVRANPWLEDLIWASEFLDHLDTLGMRIAPKKKGVQIANSQTLGEFLQGH